MSGNKRIFAQRREQLRTQVRDQHEAQTGAIFVWANIETGNSRFCQESTFYYLTGIREPACVLRIDVATGKSTLFVPHTGDVRARWVNESYDTSQQSVMRAGVDDIVYCGQPIAGYRLNPLFGKEHYECVLDAIQAAGSVFTCYPAAGDFYVNQVMIIDRVCSWLPALRNRLVDISAIVARMRRCKDRGEIELMYKASEATLAAHAAVVVALVQLRDGEMVYERSIQAAIQHSFVANGFDEAFPTIVASGVHTPFIHYAGRDRRIEKGDLLIVDCGARCGGYCSDTTRTYAVSGTFNKRQRALYDMVLDAQQYIAECAKPGMWLNNAAHPEQSLNHLARHFFAKQGYEHYFLHGIGHFLGLDVHDVGDAQEPLMSGDVITIEPGLYLHEEGLGVRIEDDYWITSGGAHCLSEELPKDPQVWEKFITADDGDLLR